MNKNFDCLTDPGLKRKINEDSVFAEAVNDPQSPFAFVLMVADGMGGHHAGEHASREAERIVKNFFVQGGYRQFAVKVGINPNNIKQILNETFFYIDKLIKKKAQEDGSGKTSGTTCTIALILKSANGNNKEVIIGHVGDSRAYIISQKAIRILTKDDSLVWQFYEKGVISYEQMRTHKDRNVIIQALGGDSLEKPQVFIETIKPDETLLVCSDGLNGMVSDSLIKNTIRNSKNITEACTALIKSANKAGGKDNVSVALYSQNFHKSGIILNKYYKAAAIVLLMLTAFIIYFLTLQKEPSLSVDGIKNQYYSGEKASVDIKVNAEDATLNIYLGKKSYKNIPVTGLLDSVVIIPLADTGNQVINVRLLDPETNEIITGISKTFYVNQKKIEWKIIQPKKILNVGEKTNLTINVLSKGIFKLKIKSDSNLDTKEYDINKQKTVQLLYEKPGDKKVEVIISDGKVTETRQIFYTIKKSEEPVFIISSSGKTVLIDNYKEIEKYIKTIDWKDGKGETKVKNGSMSYGNTKKIPEFIFINNKKYSTNKK